MTRRTRTAAIALILAGPLVACGGDDEATDPVTDTTTASESTAEFAYGTGPCPPADVDEPVRQFDDAPQLCIDPAADYTATFVSSEGDITVALDAAGQPGTVNNFVTLARYGYYDDTAIFRAEPASGLFQGGGENNRSSPGYTIPDEGSGFTYPPGTLAMARTSEADSAGAQWFFTTDEKAEYLAQYGTFVVFGHIVDGLDVAQAITALGDAQGVPTRSIALETVTIHEAAAP
jgi:cyclophilin family peptidyl-prolyl cis-trans isomerase